ncbi:GUN4 domain-containing protein [Pseudanabaena galeata UHCC 0370]|uniref:GUN4 domain-containing protein n=1 Tax=Pseudanabaena galeata UHCC 0370 TaxID=3110310 RepID=A0ABU5TJ00_9CYAN|nr:GUN4 domain-containing protein [Pseudanabaena galeata]MEA5478283.1 GUN4 domain-containing protein [Pseudanabaena galeata UHCC 0370]
MDSEEILIEFVGNGDRANGESIKSISTTKIKDSIQRLASLVQQLATDNAPSHANGLALDEVEISIKLTDTGEAILLGDGQSNGAMTLRFRRPQKGLAIANVEPSTQLQSLTSSTGVDYTKLRALLSNGKWQEANQETWNVMCQAARKNIGSVLTAEEIKQISCDDLQIIDNLWRQYSQGRYGFSAQNQIYMSSILG